MNIISKTPMRKVVDFDAAYCSYDDWYATFPKLRKESPVCWSEAHGGYWIISTYEDIQHVAREWETFSSAKSYDPKTGQAEGGCLIPVSPMPRFIPVETDPPDWKLYRHIMNPFLGPKMVDTYRKITAEVTTAMIDRVIEKGSFDITFDFVAAVPALVTLHVLGLTYDPKDWERWANPFHQLSYLDKESPDFAKCCADLAWISDQLLEQVREVRRKPRDGVLSTIANMDTKEGKLSEQDMVDIGKMFLVGGVGTTTALTANVLYFLHKDRAARKRLHDNPDMLPNAREEFVRFYSPVNSDARRVVKETELKGQKMYPGEMLLLPFSSANRDDTVFERPDEIILDRTPNPHMGFGNGIHRCAGSFLARLFFDAMFKEVMERIPDYTVDESKAERYPNIAQVNSWITIPATFTPGRKVGTSLGLDKI